MFISYAPQKAIYRRFGSLSVLHIFLGSVDVATIPAADNELLHVALSFNGSSVDIYKNGVLLSSRAWADPNIGPTRVLGAIYSKNSSFFPGLIAHPKIFNRALSPSEIKTLYMFPGDVAFGQLTADLIGANVIKAQNLITSEAIITNKAQINSGVFNEILVLDSDFTDTTNTATTAQSTANTAKTAVDNWAVPETNYTEIKGGVITTGQIKSGDYVAPAVGESFAQSGSSYDLDNASIITENFYSNENGAGIKGHIEAASGKIGQWQIDQNGETVSFGTDGFYGEAAAIFGLQAYGSNPVIGYGVRPHSSGGFVSSSDALMGRVAFLLDIYGFSVSTGGIVSVPIGENIPMTRRFWFDQDGGAVVGGNLTVNNGLKLNGYTTEQSRAQNDGYLKFNGIIIAWGVFYPITNEYTTKTLPTAFTEPPQIALTHNSAAYTTTTWFARVSGRTTTSFTCISNTSEAVMYIAIGY